MSITGGRAASLSRRIVSRLAGASPRWWGIGLGALALAVSGLFGGLDPVETRVDGPAALAEDELNRGQPWDVTVTGAGYSRDVPPLELDQEGDRWLVVAALVEVTADESRFDVFDVLRLRGADGLIGQQDHMGAKPDQVYLKRDADQVYDLHPNLAEEVYFFWEQAGDAQIPTEVDVVIIGKTQRIDSLTGHLEWLDPRARALVRVPMRDLDA